MQKVRKFNLDNPEDLAEYERLLNAPEVVIIRDEFLYTKNAASQPIITVWWTCDEMSM